MTDPDSRAASRRDFLKAGSALLASGVVFSSADCGPIALPGKPFSGQPDPHDVVIIGTGFGASVAATELTCAIPSLEVLMLEQGAYFTSPERPVPGYLQNGPRHHYQFWPTPDDDEGFRSAFLRGVRLGPSTNYRAESGNVPLHRYTQFTDVDILTASGVGGGSLIYSNVSLEPYYDAAADRHPALEEWPITLKKADYDDARSWMKYWRSVTNWVVTTAPISDDLKKQIRHLETYKIDPADPQSKTVDYSYAYLPRTRAFKHASEKMKGSWTVLEPWAPLELQLFEHGGTPPAELQGQRFCERQGRCALGCLPGARHTLNKTLISKLLTNSNVHVKLKPLSNVHKIRELSLNGKPGYEVVYFDVITGDEYRAWAKVVIVGAGVLGTTEILLRSRDRADEAGGLTTSQALGKRFSTNGDFSAFVKNIPTEVTVNGKVVDNRVWPTRGPINTSHVSIQDGKLFINVEDAGIPAMFAAQTRRILSALTRGGTISFGRLIEAALDPSIRRQTEHEMVQDIMWFNVMGTDGVPGRPLDSTLGQFSLDGSGKMQLKYPSGNPVDHPVFGKIEEILRAMAKEMGQGAEYAPFPLWGGLFGKRKLVVTHPLGGCPMGKTSADGAVDTQGRLFKTGNGGTDVHQGLFVMDGSVLPGPVAVNPTLTIVAVALRTVGSVIDYLGGATANCPRKDATARVAS